MNAAGQYMNAIDPNVSGSYITSSFMSISNNIGYCMEILGLGGLGNDGLDERYNHAEQSMAFQIFFVLFFSWSFLYSLLHFMSDDKVYGTNFCSYKDILNNFGVWSRERDGLIAIGK